MAKTKVIKESQLHQTDTGSAAVQISLLSKRIKKLSVHLKKNTKDDHSRRGLLKMVAHRKKLIKYLKNSDEEAVKKLAQKFDFKI
ncbi:MAG: 30S ribosomal protein S15 [Candidatus Moranbacteria bacterium]|nr:30S ribosomal protein S15 [Candidatus Moranbacteria bacterium]